MESVQNNMVSIFVILTYHHWSDVSVSYVFGVKIIQGINSVIFDSSEILRRKSRLIFFMMLNHFVHISAGIRVKSSAQIMSGAQIFLNTGGVAQQIQHISGVKVHPAPQIHYIKSCLLFAVGQFFFNENHFSTLVVLHHVHRPKSGIVDGPDKLEVFFLVPLFIVLLCL